MSIEEFDLQEDFDGEPPVTEESADGQHALVEAAADGWSRFSAPAPAPHQEWDSLAGDTALGALLRVAAQRGRFG